LLRAWEAINKEVATLSRRLVTEARQDDTVCRLMPGVGVLVALVSTIGDPARFPHAASVGAYVTPRRFQSGETDYTGKISRCGDRLTRTYLYEAAGIILNRVSRWSTLKAWGTRLARKIGHKKAPWQESSPSFSTGCGVTALNSAGRTRRRPWPPPDPTMTSSAAFGQRAALARAR
jgi:transposase